MYIGAEVEAGDVLVGKVTPKGETQLTPEEKLLRAIFGEKASDVKDTPLRVPSGMSGTVIDVQVFTREGIQRDKRAQQIIDDELKRYRLDLNDQLRIVEGDAFQRLARMLTGKVANGGPKKLAKGTKIEQAYLEDLDHYHWFDIRLADEEAAAQLEAIKDSIEQKRLPVRSGVRRKAQEAHARRRTAAGRAEDGQGVSGSQAPPAASATRWPAATVTRVSCRRSFLIEDMPYMADGSSGRRRAEPARRAVADERGSGSRKCIWAGPRSGLGRAYRRNAEASGEDRLNCANS